MESIKYGDTYIKSMCTMIARGDILDIEMFRKYLEYADLDRLVEVSTFELDMLFGVNIDKISPKYYICDSDFERKYYPIDLILYSCVCNKYFYSQKQELLKDILQLENIDFSCISKTLEYVVSVGDLELFKLLNSIDNINYNYKCYKLRNGEPYSILDNCLSLVVARLTINGEFIARSYPREILEFFLSMDKGSIDLELLKTTPIMIKCIDNKSDEYLSNVTSIEDLFCDIKNLVNNYKFNSI